MSTKRGGPAALSCKCVIESLGRWGSLGQLPVRAFLRMTLAGYGHTGCGNPNGLVALFWGRREGAMITPGLSP